MAEQCNPYKRVYYLQGMLQPYGQNILKYGIGQLGTPIDVGADDCKSCRSFRLPTKITATIGGHVWHGRHSKRYHRTCLQVLQGGTGVASYQPYLDQISQQQFIRSI